MPKVGTKVQEGADDVRIGMPYTILTAEVVQTEKAAYNGIRVGLVDKNKDDGSVMLWHRAVTSPRSKLGAFITLLGDDTDKWLGQKIVFKDWQEGARVIELAK